MTCPTGSTITGWSGISTTNTAANASTNTLLISPLSLTISPLPSFKGPIVGRPFFFHLTCVENIKIFQCLNFTILKIFMWKELRIFHMKKKLIILFKSFRKKYLMGTVFLCLFGMYLQLYSSYHLGKNLGNILCSCLWQPLQKSKHASIETF